MVDKRKIMVQENSFEDIIISEESLKEVWGNKEDEKWTIEIMKENGLLSR
ncbi:MAG: hypothetical protein AABW90_03605 [Nanoarchaeota archaeon]